MQKDLPDYPGKEMMAITVTYPRARSIRSIVTMRTRSSTCSKARSSWA